MQRNWRQEPSIMVCCLILLSPKDCKRERWRCKKLMETSLLTRIQVFAHNLVLVFVVPSTHRLTPALPAAYTSKEICTKDMWPDLTSASGKCPSCSLSNFGSLRTTALKTLTACMFFWPIGPCGKAKSTSVKLMLKI